MKPDDKTERTKPVGDRDENPGIEREPESEATEVQEPQPTGWAAQLRQIMHGSAQGECFPNKDGYCETASMCLVPVQFQKGRER